MRKSTKVLSIFLVILIISTAGLGYLFVITKEENLALEKSVSSLNEKIAVLDPEIGTEKSGIVYASTSWLVYDDLNSALLGGKSTCTVGDLISKLTESNIFSISGNEKIGIYYIGKNTYETYDGVHHHIVYSVAGNIYITPAE